MLVFCPQKKIPEAIGLIEGYIQEHKPRYAVPFFELIQLYRQSGNNDQAKVVLEQLHIAGIPLMRADKQKIEDLVKDFGN